MNEKIILFGEAEKGLFNHPYHFKSLYELATTIGNPPENSQGINYAVQALYYQREVIFFRVEEEGFSLKEYFQGLDFLKDKENLRPISALCLPGVGNPKIIEISSHICDLHKSILIITEKDLFDFLTSF